MVTRAPMCISFFFFNDTATTEIYTLSLHDALPISEKLVAFPHPQVPADRPVEQQSLARRRVAHRKSERERCTHRSEEHTSELQSRLHLVCRLLLEKKNDRHPRPPAHRAHCSLPHRA